MKTISIQTNKTVEQYCVKCSTSINVNNSLNGWCQYCLADYGAVKCPCGLKLRPPWFHSYSAICECGRRVLFNDGRLAHRQHMKTYRQGWCYKAWNRMRIKTPDYKDAAKKRRVLSIRDKHTLL